MKNIIKKICYQIRILNSLYYLVFLTFLIDLSIIVVLKHVIAEIGFMNISLLSLLAVLRIAFYSGFYGIITEIISGQELFFQYKRFKQNIKDNWAFSVLLIVFVLILYCIALINSPNSEISILLFFSYFDIVFCFGLGYLIISKKYTFVGIKKIHFDGQLLFSMLLFYFIKIVLTYLLSNWNEGPILVYKLIALTSQYLHFLLFVNISMQLTQNCSLEFPGSSSPELYLINPVMPGVLLPIEHAFIGNWYCFYPPAFVVIGALTPKKYKIREFCNILWNDMYYKRGKLVAITCGTSNVHEAYKIAKGFKEKGSTVVMGGAHVTFMSDEALEYCDSVVIGEAVGVWEEVIEDYEKNTLKKKYYGMGYLDYPESVQKALMGLNDEIVTKFIQTTRGCKFNCDFCSTPILCGPTIRKRPVEDVVALINKVRLKNKRVLFLDDNIYADSKYFFTLFEEIKKLKIKLI
ncbi:MAG: cobalamin-dependent protein, partial [Candidatus Omnitrophica bacterium]|nr:cobalamin-dependent protein [Candidatus Omnitrophota bacterium]